MTRIQKPTMTIDIFEQGDRLISRCTFAEFVAENNAFEPHEIDEIRAGLERDGEITITGFVGCFWKLVRSATDDAGRSLAARRSRIAQEIADEINAPLRAMTAHERAMLPLLRELLRLQHRACDVQADYDDDREGDYR